MKRAIDETNRRRKMQIDYNRVNNIKPQTIIKNIQRSLEITQVAEQEPVYDLDSAMSAEEIQKQILKLEKQMKAAAKTLEFEKAASLRDQIIELKARIGDIDE
jgi:excinuclease ABC subunit B